MRMEGPTEADYAEGARIALDRRDMRLALEQIGGALSFRPLADEHRATLELILSRTSTATKDSASDSATSSAVPFRSACAPE
jgi:hypothetical protein